MTSFEYITIPVSIVLALGLGRVLTAFIGLVDRQRRDWLHLVWCLSLAAGMLGQWLAIWPLNTNQVWNGFEFFVVMFSPILYFTAAHVLVPGNLDSVDSWAEHLSKIARPLLILMLLSVVNFFVRNYVILEDFEIGPNVQFAILISLLHLVAVFRPSRFLLSICAFSWFAPVLFLILGFELT